MKTKNGLVVILTIVLLLLMTNNSYSKIERETENQTGYDSMDMDNTSASEELQTAMRKLWEDHIVWTRNVILCLTDKLPGTDQAVARLLKNQEDIGTAIKSFYGDAAGDKLTELLKQHITIAADVVTAAAKGDGEALGNAQKKWHDNANEIAAFLSGANPNLKLSEMESMMNDHLKLTTDEAVARITKNYEADVEAYDKVQGEILMMADQLAEAIVKQFPDKFKQ